MSRATTAEPIKMPFGTCTQMGSSNHMLDGGEGAIFKVIRGWLRTCRDMSTDADWGAIDGVHIGEYN